MPTSNNYKSKWLAALKETDDSPLVAAEKAGKVASTINTVNVNANLELGKLQRTTLEATGVAKSILNLMDEHRYTAGLEFGTCCLPIDGKLSQMTLQVMLRRIRDTLKIAESRIGILSIAANDLYEANALMRKHLKMVESGQLPLQRSIIECALIGPRATSPEMEDLRDSKTGEYHRYGMTYEDLDDDWLDRHLASGPTHNNGAVDGDDSESDDANSDDNEKGSNALIRHGREELDLGI